MSRRLWWAWVAGLVLAAGAAGQGGSALDFIQLTDTHVTELRGVAPALAKTRGHFSGSGKALGEYFEALADPVGRPYRPAFFLITGDLIDAFRFAGAGGGQVDGQIAAFRRATSRSPAPLYLALGNHDITDWGLAAGEPDSDQSSAGEARAAWIAAEESFRRGTYYNFEKHVGSTAYLFLVLDNAYNSGRIADEQMAWLRRQVEGQGQRVLILAMHIPLGEDANSRAIKSALSAARVALVLAGHRHSNGIEEIPLGGGQAVQVRTAAFGYGASNWRRIRLLDGRIEVFATGQPDRLERTMAVPAAAAAR